jgi:hypothetical protein
VFHDQSNRLPPARSAWRWCGFVLRRRRDGGEPAPAESRRIPGGTLISRRVRQGAWEPAAPTPNEFLDISGARFNQRLPGPEDGTPHDRGDADR